MTAKHTPGPWQARAGIGRWNVTTTAAPRTFNICSINTDRLEQDANARLIAAAPETAAERDRLKAINAELVTALRIALKDKARQYRDTFDSRMDNDLIVIAIRAAIAKARREM